SIFSTSAPRSPRLWVQNGPASTRVRSTTLIPASGPGQFSWCSISFNFASFVAPDGGRDPLVSPSGVGNVDPDLRRDDGSTTPIRHLAAVTMISTRISGRAISARTQARQGGLAGSTQSFHTAFICENRAMSLIHRLAVRRLDLLVPACAR